MKIAIAGITGFVGTNLTRYLNQHTDWEVHGLVRNLQTQKLDGLQINGLLHSQDYEGMLKLKPEVVVQLAGRAHDLKKVSSEKDYFEVNYNYTVGLFKQFQKLGRGKFIYMSTVKAVADQVQDVLTETHAPAPATVYGKSKLAAEKHLGDSQLSSDQQLYILRPCMIHGPGNKGNLNLLYQFVSKGLPYPLAAYENKRSFLSVENLSFAIRQLIEKPIPSGIYNLADSEDLSTNELIGLIGEAIDKPVKRWKLSPKVVRLIARVGDKLPLPLNSERLQKLTENYQVSNAKILAALGVQLPVNSRQGIINTVKTFSK